MQVGAAIMLYTARLGGPGLDRGLILAGSAAGVAAAFKHAARRHRLRDRGDEPRIRAAHQRAGADRGDPGRPRLARACRQLQYFGSSSAMLRVTIDWLAPIFCGVVGGVAGAPVRQARHRRHAAHQGMARGGASAARTGPRLRLRAHRGDLRLAEPWRDLRHGLCRGAARVEGGHLPWYFTPLKFIATAASTLSGIPGGLFAPSLSVGAGLGEMTGTLLGVHTPSAVVLLGMAAYFAGVTQAPITAFVIIDEMTDARGMVIPLMIAALHRLRHLASGAAALALSRAGAELRVRSEGRRAAEILSFSRVRDGCKASRQRESRLELLHRASGGGSMQATSMRGNTMRNTIMTLAPASPFRSRPRRSPTMRSSRRRSPCR